MSNIVSWPAFPAQTGAEDYLQLAAASGLILYTLLRPLFKFTKTPAQRKWNASRSFQLLLQASIAATCTLVVFFKLRAANSQPRDDWMPLSLYAFSGAAAGVNILGLALRQGSAARGCCHLSSSMLWSWRLFISQTSVTAASEVLLCAFALSFLLDAFDSTLPVQLALSSSRLTLSESLSFGWLTRIIESPQAPNFDNLSDIGLVEGFDDYWKRLHKPSSQRSSPMSDIFLGFIFREHTRQIASSAILRLADDASKFALPWLLTSLITRPTPWNVCLMFCSRIVGALCGNYSGYYLREVSAQYKAALSAALHEKTLRLGDLRQSSQGADLATLGEVDTRVLYSATQKISDIWALPIQILLCLCGLAYLLTWQALIAVLAVILMIVPVMGIFLKSIGHWVTLNMSAKDHRTKLIIEALGVVQSIKMHAWESTFVDLIAERRANELKTVQGTAISTSGLVCCMQGLPSLMVLAAFGVLILMNQQLTSELVFASLLLFTMLNNSLIQLSGLASLVQTVVISSNRIQHYIELSETKLSGLEAKQLPQSEHNAPIHLRCDALGWPDSPPLIASGDVHINHGALAVITGGMGSGKSTLLLAILRNLEQSVSDPDRVQIVHVPQIPLLIRGSIRDNILFGKPYDAQRYSQAIRACCLDVDLARLKHGDSTLLIGTSTLSGGQSAPISLARAAYFDADIFLFDDPLAAIDVKVSSDIIARLIGPAGLLKNSTRVICTTDKAIIRNADSVHEITQNSISSHQVQPQPPDAGVEIDHPAEQDQSDSQMNTVLCATTVDPAGGPNTDLPAQAVDPIVPCSGRSPILTYILSAKRSSWLQAISVLFLARASSVLGTYVLKIMANEPSAASLARDLALFGLTSVSQILLFLCFVNALYRLCVVPAAFKLHRNLTTGIFSQSLGFFQTTQIGEILNLFTNDIARIDGSLNISIATLMGQYTNLAVSCAILVTSLPLCIALVIPMLAASYRLQLAYLVKLRELRRLDVSSRSPLVDYLQEAEKGQTTFSTFKIASSRQTQFNEYLAYNLRALFPLSCLDLWIGLRLEVISVILQVVALGILLRSGVDVGTLGFVMTYLFQVTATLSTIATTSAQCEADAVSVARVDEYSRLYDKGEVNLDIEGAIPYSDTGPDSAWPRYGKVEFKSMSVRHRPDLPTCLESITLSISPGEKVAVVGRTGAGKSSLVLSLLRMMDQTGGQILIDDLDINQIDPVRLRRSLGLMPQAQVVLSGSVRKNLDPLGLHSDTQIAECLDTCGLWSRLGNLTGSEEVVKRGSGSLLDFEFEDGSNLSKGEKQIVSVARAMLQNSSILLLDEATSGMDDSTETFVHDTIFGKLPNTTVLAIMHRLKLTLLYDKVLVIDHGRVVAFDTPAALMADEDSLYYSMIREDGHILAQAQELFNLS